MVALTRSSCMPVSRLREIGELDEALVREDLEHELGVPLVVVDELLAVVREGVRDLVSAAVAGHQLALAEEGLRRGLELVVVEPDEGAAHEREAVEHQAAQEHGARASRVKPWSRWMVDLVVGAAEAEGDAVLAAERAAAR